MQHSYIWPIIHTQCYAPKKTLSHFVPFCHDYYVCMLYHILLRFFYKKLINCMSFYQKIITVLDYNDNFAIQICMHN